VSIVVALGGNAIKKAEDSGSFEEQLENVDRTAAHIARLCGSGQPVVVTHGNGPQVGTLLLQQEAMAHELPPQPLAVCGAMTQGHIGWMLQNRLGYHLSALGRPAPASVAAVVTQTEVDPDDPEFRSPSKPVGPFYTADEARKLIADTGHQMAEVRPHAEKGWRRLVPSPKPLGIVEQDVIRVLVASGVLLIASGGGGVPVARTASGMLQAMEGVIDKDLAAVVLARTVGASRLLILTDISGVSLHYGTAREERLGTVTCSRMEGYLAAEHFGNGSMRPKVQAAVDFVKSGGESATIASLDEVEKAMNYETGTHVVA
jgi:carbamate kinase